MKDKSEENKKPLVINRPENLSKIRRGSEWTVTGVGWIVWMVICRPLLLLVLWYFGVIVFYEQMIQLDGLTGLKQMWFVYVTLFAVVIVLIRGWGFYNKMRFKNKTRRKSSPATTIQQVAQTFYLSEQDMQAIQNSPTLSIDFLDQHQIIIKNKFHSSQAGIKGYYNPTH